MNIIRLLVNIGRIQKIQGGNPGSMSSKAIKVWLPNGKKEDNIGILIAHKTKEKTDWMGAFTRFLRIEGQIGEGK